MPDQDLTSLDEQKPDGQVDQVFVLDDAEHDTRRKLKAWANQEHRLTDGGHTIYVWITPPVTPVPWQLWFNSDTNELLIYHGDLLKWVTVQQPTFNYLYNPSFSRFPNATFLPTGWNRYGTSTTGTTTIAGAGMPNPGQKFGPFALQVTSGDGYINVYQIPINANGLFGPMFYWATGQRTLSLGCWVWANVPNSASIFIAAEGVGSTVFSPTHPGNSTWRWLVTTMKLSGSFSLTGISVTLSTFQPNTTALFSAPTLVEGSWCPRVIPSDLFLRSSLLHVGSASGALDAVAGVTTFYGPQGSATFYAGAYAVMPLRCLISNLRFYVTASPGAGKNYTGRLIHNGVDTPLLCTVTDANTFAFNNTDKIEVFPGGTLSLRVLGSAGANTTAIRASFLVEEIPAAIF